MPSSEQVDSSVEPSFGSPRVQYAIRTQVEMVMTDLDALIVEDHPVRVIWSYLEQAELSELYSQIKALEGGAGRAPIDPKILLALWMYATCEGIGSARAVARLSAEHAAYRWICGGVSVNYHTLADFRSGSGALLDRLLTEHIAMLRAADLVTLKRVAHDGMRVRASAGAGSFRRLATLEEYRAEAAGQVEALRKELAQDPAAADERSKAARQRAARERQERIEAALRQYPEAWAHKKKDKQKTCLSTTDPDARKMRMADGGFRPAYNVQMSVDASSLIVVDAHVSNSGSDGGQLLPAVERIEQRYGSRPQEVLADSGFADRDDIEKLESAAEPCTVYLPPPELKTHAGAPIEVGANEAPEVKAWRKRMQTPQAQEIYRQRASSVECVNAQMRNRALQQFSLRGLCKVRAVALLFALVHNVMRAAVLRRAESAAGSG